MAFLMTATLGLGGGFISPRKRAQVRDGKSNNVLEYGLLSICGDSTAWEDL